MSFLSWRCNITKPLVFILPVLSIYYILMLRHDSFHSRTVAITDNTILVDSASNNMSSTIHVLTAYKEQLTLALRPENRNITLIINSCGRLDLLNTTITSFMQYWPHGKYPLHEKMIIDDSRDNDIAKALIDRYYPSFEILLTADNQFETHYINRDERITFAMDKAFKQVSTSWIYHIEDDWEFIRYNFVDESFDIFETSIDNTLQTGKQWINSECKRYENENIKEECPAPMTGLNNTYPNNYRHGDRDRPERWRGQPLDHFFFNPHQKYSIVVCWTLNNRNNFINKTFLYEYKDAKWYDMQYFLKHYVTWGGFSFNSGLLPTALYRLLIKDFFSPKGEWGVSQLLIKHGFKVALLGKVACNHIGKARHITGTVPENARTRQLNNKLIGKIH
eukprot:1558_1